MSAASLPLVEPVDVARQHAAAEPSPPQRLLDPESREWLESLRGQRATHDEAIARLHALLLRAARFEAIRRRPTLPHLRGGELDDIAMEAADDALMSVLARLDDFRGASRFTTWAYKFALLEAAVKLRKRSWRRARGRRSRTGPSLQARAAASSPTPKPSKASFSKLCRARSRKF